VYYILYLQQLMMPFHEAPFKLVFYASSWYHAKN
jgi:hypothetical protein